MELATQYAKALYSAEKPTVTGLRAALKKRGHEKLMPRIYAEFKKLELQEQRREVAQKVTPEQERTRVLLQLYKALIS